jgi:hypothetical protein
VRKVFASSTCLVYRTLSRIDRIDSDARRLGTFLGTRSIAISKAARLRNVNFVDSL